MSLQDLLSIGIVGAALSGAIQILKAKLTLNSNGAKAVTVLLAVALGALYWFLRDTDLWKTILGVLAASQIVYGFLLKKSSPDANLF